MAAQPIEAGGKPRPPRDLEGYSLLAVFAHPDDESLACGGLLARCAEGGARVSLLCLTHGEGGPDGRGAEPGREPTAEPMYEPTPASLGETRARELHEAARVLGISNVVLLDHEDGMLPWVDRGVLEADIATVVRRLAPDVVVTFDEDGLYWHPDHVAVHERASSAVAALGTEAPALYYVTLPVGAMRALADRTGGTLLGIADADAFGAHAPTPTLVLDAGRHTATKLAALGSHRSQVAGGALERLDAEDAARYLGVEQYRRAELGALGETFLDRLAAPFAAPGA
jgi:N-acetyl-1-D-myo-inositol-2-amino-2-deoxy-alpha-D-glucopyranoside deacetylase